MSHRPYLTHPAIFTAAHPAQNFLIPFFVPFVFFVDYRFLYFVGLAPTADPAQPFFESGSNYLAPDLG